MLRKAGCCKTKEVATGNGAAVRVSTAKVPVSAMAGRPALVFRVLSEKRLAQRQDFIDGDLAIVVGLARLARRDVGVAERIESMSDQHLARTGFRSHTRR